MNIINKIIIIKSFLSLIIFVFLFSMILIKPSSSQWTTFGTCGSCGVYGLCLGPTYGLCGPTYGLYSSCEGMGINLRSLYGSCTYKTCWGIGCKIADPTYTQEICPKGWFTPENVYSPLMNLNSLSYIDNLYLFNSYFLTRHHIFGIGEKTENIWTCELCIPDIFMTWSEPTATPAY